MSIDSLDPIQMVPKYFRMANAIRHKIEDQEWEPHQPIPSERQLERFYNVSRITIRKAIEVLISQGYLYREHGRGTFVSPQKLQKKIVELTSFSEDMIRRGFEPGQKILSIEKLQPPQKIKEKLELPSESDELLFIERIRLSDQKPIGYQISYVLIPEGQTITKEELEEKGSLYTILQEKFNIIPTEAEETLESTVASIREAQLLNTAEGSPLLLNSRILFSQQRKPVEFVKILYRGDRYKYTVRLKR
ncbi:MAG: GntR family transcriptional regulator [Anaerolineaceae bacterium]|nr:GntR family transcriptional regulator [Anaerolineaceae bacterium]